MRISNQPRRSARVQAGFTLVELITVILILGVLAAVALPRYADLQGKARAAKVNAIAGSIKAASSIVKATAMANSVSCSTASVAAGVSLEGLGIDLNYCYPQALGSFTTGVLGAANVGANDNWTIVGGAAAAGTTVTLEASDAATVGTTCAVTYTSPGAAASSPSIGVATTGC